MYHPLIGALYVYFGGVLYSYYAPIRQGVIKSRLFLPAIAVMDKGLLVCQ